MYSKLRTQEKTIMKFKFILTTFLFHFPMCAYSVCEENKFSCVTSDGKYGTCVNDTCRIIQAEERTDLRFIIVVKYPEAILKTYGGNTLHVRRNALGLSWNKGLQLNKTDRDTWQTLITYRSASTGFSPNFGTGQTTFIGAALEYRIYIDDTTDMIGGNTQIKLPISKASSYFLEVPKFFAYPWFFSKKGSTDMVAIASPQIGRNRKIFIYKPPSFDENSYKLYPTIIAFDFTEELYNISAELINKAIVESERFGEYVLVGFGDYDPPDERTLLLTPVTGPGYECINGTRPDGCNGCFPAGVKNYTEILQYMMDGCGKPVRQGGKGNDTLDFLVDTVLPKVQQVVDNRALADQPNLGVMGFSLGGLMACHAAWTRPNTFSMAACQSPSLWWPIRNITANDFFFNKVTLKDTNLRENRRFQKIYLDVGGAETGEPYKMAKAILASADEMANTGFFEWDRNLWANVYPGEHHTYESWFSRMWVPLNLFFQTNPAPRLESIGHMNCKTWSNAANRSVIHVGRIFTMSMCCMAFLLHLL